MYEYPHRFMPLLCGVGREGQNDAQLERRGMSFRPLYDPGQILAYRTSEEQLRDVLPSIYFIYVLLQGTTKSRYFREINSLCFDRFTYLQFT